MLPIDPTLQQSPCWEADLALEFATRDGATRLTGCRHRGPLRVQRALYPEGSAVCQAILLHPPAGIAGGDHLRICAALASGAHAQITTPGAGKWYRSGGPEASQQLDFEVGQNAVLEWLPQESIVFDGAKAHMETQVRLDVDSAYLGWEILCLGRRAAGERFAAGQLGLETRIERCGRPLWLERGQFSGDDRVLHSRTGWAGATVCGTVLATLPASGATGLDVAALLTACRLVHPADDAEHGVSALPGLIVARYLGQHSEAARHWFTALWQTLRPPLIGRPALPPRIWNT